MNQNQIYQLILLKKAYFCLKFKSMNELTIKIESQHFANFLAYLKTLDYVKVEKIEGKPYSPDMQDFVNGLHDALNEVDLIEKGLKKGKPAREFLKTREYF